MTNTPIPNLISPISNYILPIRIKESCVKCDLKIGSFHIAELTYSLSENSNLRKIEQLFIHTYVEDQPYVDKYNEGSIIYKFKISKIVNEGLINKIASETKNNMLYTLQHCDGLILITKYSRILGHYLASLNYDIGIINTAALNKSEKNSANTIKMSILAQKRLELQEENLKLKQELLKIKSLFSRAEESYVNISKDIAMIESKYAYTPKTNEETGNINCSKCTHCGNLEQCNRGCLYQHAYICSVCNANQNNCVFCEALI